ncbi:uncharacterized protein LOC132708802 [Cylas formicarius]|uniref:uncharacterized protein LOC132708802 n=1 Tax=Cylas formicarius TaxID=197179 RepID=UPI002958BC7C|nr:uncharacterized protein LOC132708802 [Cylas formicarius]
MYLNEIPKSTITLVNNFPKDHTSRMIKMALACLQPQPQDLSKVIEKFSKEKNIEKHEISEVLSIYIAILKVFVNSNDKDFIQQLLEVGFTNKFLEDLPLVSNRQELVDTYFMPSYEHFQNVDTIKWRIDISLHNSTLGSKILPSIMLIIKMKDGRCYTIEMNLIMFHKLRFNIAVILKEMSKLKSSSIVNNSSKLLK